MALLENIYSPLEPFTKYPVLASRFVAAYDTRLDLRPLCLRTDLQSLYDWQNDPSKCSNFHTNAGEVSALFFHKRILESVNGQSLLVLANDKPLSLWTFTPAQYDSHLKKYSPGVHDKSIEFLFRDRNRTLIRESLALCIELCSRHGKTGKLFASLPKDLKEINAIFLDTGFRPSDAQVYFMPLWNAHAI